MRGQHCDRFPAGETSKRSIYMNSVKRARDRQEFPRRSANCWECTPDTTTWPIPVKQAAEGPRVQTHFCGARCHFHSTHRVGLAATRRRYPRYSLETLGWARGVQFAVFLGHAVDLNCPPFRSGLFSAKGTFLCQPRVERHESANVAEPWETRLDRTESPNGAVLTGKVTYD